MAKTRIAETTAAPGKPGARPTAVAAIDALDPAGPSTVMVRVNPIGTPWFTDDLAGLVDGQTARAVLARAEPARAEPSSGERPS